MHESSKYVRAAALVLFAAALAGCPSKSGGSSPSDGGAAANAEPVNAGDITRYPYERKIDKEPATVVRDGVVVHKSPPDGPQVATLANGAAVVKIAQDARSFLVVFDDAPSGKRMMGWVGEDAFTVAPPDAGAPSRPGAPPKKEPGGPTAIDAGAPAAAVDAGGGRGGGPTAGIVAPSGGACPASYTLVADDKMCHMTCVRGPECPAKFRCRDKVCQPIK